MYYEHDRFYQLSIKLKIIVDFYLLSIVIHHIFHAFTHFLLIEHKKEENLPCLSMVNYRLPPESIGEPLVFTFIMLLLPFCMLSFADFLFLYIERLSSFSFYPI